VQSAIIHSVDEIPECVAFFGITTGDVSLIDVIDRVLVSVPNASIDIAIWTIGMRSLSRLRGMMASGDVQFVRLLIDRSYGPRNRAYTKTLTDTIGMDNIRVSLIHAKLVIVRNSEISALISTSMNLNTNRRYETFSIVYEPEPVRVCGELFDDWFASPCEHFDDYIGVKDAYTKRTGKSQDATGFDAARFDLPLRG